MDKKKLLKRKLVKKRSSKFSTKLYLGEVDWEKVEKIFTSEKDLIIKRLATEKTSLPVREILTLLAAGAVFALSLTVPTLPMALAPFVIDRSKYKKNLPSQTLSRLKKQKLVKIIEENGQTLVKITEEGRVRALRYKIEEMTVKKPKVWDKKWRVVIFDIPEKAKRMREIFRDRLKALGFYRLQKSVWIHPFPCFNEIEFLRQVYHVGVEVTYIVAEKIEGVENLKSYFQLA